MKNRELIRQLKDYNPEADVSLVDSEDIVLSYVCKDSEQNDLTPMETPHLWIEGVDLCPSCVHEYIEFEERMCSFYGKPCRMVGECFQYEEFTE